MNQARLAGCFIARSKFHMTVWKRQPQADVFVSALYKLSPGHTWSGSQQFPTTPAFHRPCLFPPLSHLCHHPHPRSQFAFTCVHHPTRTRILHYYRHITRMEMRCKFSPCFSSMRTLVWASCAYNCAEVCGTAGHLFRLELMVKLAKQWLGLCKQWRSVVVCFKIIATLLWVTCAHRGH